MSPAVYVCCIYSNALQSNFFMEENNINPDQTAPKEQSDLGPYCLQYRLPKNISRRLEQKTKVMTGRKSIKVSKGAKIRNRYNQVPQLTQDTDGKVTNSKLDTTNESQEVSPFPAGDHKAHMNRSAQRHIKHKTEKNIKDPQKNTALDWLVKIFYWRA